MSVTVETPLSVPTSTSGNINGVQHIVNSLRSGLTSNDFKPVQDGSNDSYGAKDDEIHTHKNRVHVDFTEFYGIEPTQVDRRFDLTLSDLSYLPKVDNPRADWVVTAALNAFRAYQAAGFDSVQRFATVGTGSGTDVLAALDTFPKLASVALTDLHAEVVKVAKLNVLSATKGAKKSVRTTAEQTVARAGDLLWPLKGEKQFDLIYENLPNIPLPDTGNLTDGQTSSTYVGDRRADRIPSSISAALLELHYVCLVQARVFELISPKGAVLSSIGGRVALQELLDMADKAGYSGRILSLSWKEQSEPESVIGGYAESEKKGGRPFSFYPTSVLKTAFKDRTPAGAGLCAFQIEQQLLPHRLSAIEALERHRQGTSIAHTVVVMASTPKNH